MKSFCTSFSDKILNVDIYGTKPQFNLGKIENFKTSFGSFLTIVSISITVLAVSYFSLQLLDDSNPKLVSSIRNIFNPPLVYLNETNYGIAFGLQNPFTYDQFVDETIYRAEAFHMTGSRVSKGNTSYFDWKVKQLEVERCSLNKFPNAYSDLYKDVPLTNYYCFKNNSFSLFGTFLNPEYQYIMIKLFECKNSTERNITNCQAKSYIDEILAGAFFGFSHTDLTIDPTNYLHPNQLYAGDSYTTVSNKFFKEMHHYLNIINFDTDKGWLMSDIKKQTFLKLDYIKEMTDFRKADNFLSYAIKLSTKVETYARSYSKVQNIAAEAGGFLKITSVVCLLISFYYNKSKFYEYIGQELMSEQAKESGIDPERNNKNIFIKNQDYENLGKIDSTTKQNNYFNENTDNKNISSKHKDNFKNLNMSNINIKRKKSKKIRLNVSFCESFRYLFCYMIQKKNQNFKKLNFIRRKTDDLLDLLNLFRNINDIDRIKKIIMDDDQVKLFNLPYKYELNFNNPKLLSQTTLIHDQNKIPLENEVDVSIIFNIVAGKEDRISKKLVELVNC